MKMRVRHFQPGAGLTGEAWHSAMTCIAGEGLGGDDVPDEVIVKGYELSKGNYVLVSEDELAALDPESQRTIDIEEFVDLADIDPIFYDHPYYLAPAAGGAKPYTLLLAALCLFVVVVVINQSGFITGLLNTGD